MLQWQQLNSPHASTFVLPRPAPLGQLWWCAQAKFTNLQLKSLWQFFAMQFEYTYISKAQRVVCVMLIKVWRYVYASVTCIQRVYVCVCVYVCAQLIWCIVDFLAFSRQILIDIWLCGAHKGVGRLRHWARRSGWANGECVCVLANSKCNAKTVSIKQLAPLKQIQHVLWLINWSIVSTLVTPKPIAASAPAPCPPLRCPSSIQCLVTLISRGFCCC